MAITKKCNCKFWDTDLC